MNSFEPFIKIPRLSREVIVTEKIDGTNAQIFIWDSEMLPLFDNADIPWLETAHKSYLMAAGSRNRWLTSDNDNFGFAQWAATNSEELCKLGPGRHFGEWWGLGIQRGYGITEKRFSLFNVNRWSDAEYLEEADKCPACCHVIPVLYRGNFDTNNIQQALEMLRVCGSVAAPGYAQPEGIVIYHTASHTLFKKTIDHDEAPKGKSE